MLANLDNEVHFRNVFTDTEVFTAFAEDILNIEINVDVVESRYLALNRIGAIKFRTDFWAKDNNSLTVVEIRLVDYDFSCDRFVRNFSGNIIDIQRSSRDYSFDKNVYVIVVVTAAYRISELNGKPIKDDVLLTHINPSNLQGVERKMTKHQMIILNTTYVDENTPESIKDWLDLIIESMNNPENPKINLQKPSIAKAAKLAEKNLLTPEQMADAKIEEMWKKTIAIVADTTREETEKKTKKDTIDASIKSALQQGILSPANIAELFKVSVDYVEKIRAEGE